MIDGGHRAKRSQGIDRRFCGAAFGEFMEEGSMEASARNTVYRAGELMHPLF